MSSFEVKEDVVQTEPEKGRSDGVERNGPRPATDPGMGPRGRGLGHVPEFEDEADSQLRKVDGDECRPADDVIDLPDLLRVLTRYLWHRVPAHELDEVVDEALVKTAQAWIRRGKNGSICGLALKVAHDAAADWRRRQERRPEIQPLSGNERQHPSDASRSHESRATLERMLADARPLLSDRQREVADQLLLHASRTSLARHMCLSLKNLNAMLIAIAKKIQRLPPENSPPPDG